jgi:branched-chain amino acid transport system substrate-binding protein
MVIGVMGDQSGVVADVGGPGSIVAARMAVADFADFGGSVDGITPQRQAELGVAALRNFDIFAVALNCVRA